MRDDLYTILVQRAIYAIRDLQRLHRVLAQRRIVRDLSHCRPMWKQEQSNSNQARRKTLAVIKTLGTLQEQLQEICRELLREDGDQQSLEN